MKYRLHLEPFLFANDFFLINGRLEFYDLDFFFRLLFLNRDFYLLSAFADIFADYLFFRPGRFYGFNLFCHRVPVGIDKCDMNISGRGAAAKIQLKINFEVSFLGGDV